MRRVFSLVVSIEKQANPRVRYSKPRAGACSEHGCRIYVIFPIRSPIRLCLLLYSKSRITIRMEDNIELEDHRRRPPYLVIQAEDVVKSMDACWHSRVNSKRTIYKTYPNGDTIEARPKKIESNRSTYGWTDYGHEPTMIRFRSLDGIATFTFHDGLDGRFILLELAEPDSEGLVPALSVSSMSPEGAAVVQQVWDTEFAMMGKDVTTFEELNSAPTLPARLE